MSPLVGKGMSGNGDMLVFGRLWQVYCSLDTDLHQDIIVRLTFRV
jgi:hypothetical protein